MRNPSEILFQNDTIQGEFSPILLVKSRDFWTRNTDPKVINIPKMEAYYVIWRSRYTKHVI